MSKQADERSRKRMDEAIANFHVKPRIFVSMRGVTSYAPRRSGPNRPGTRKVSKLSRRAVPFGSTVTDRKKLAR